MRHLEVLYRPEAIADLEEIYRFVVSRSKDRSGARSFILRIKARCRRIGLVPEGGTPRDDLEEGLRTVPFERKAVIVYKVEDNCVRIGNIFYGGKDYEALYRQVGGPADEIPAETR